MRWKAQGSLFLAAPLASAYFTPDPPEWSRRDLLCALAGSADIFNLHPSEDPSSESASFPGHPALHWHGSSLDSGRLVQGPRHTCAVVSSSGVLQAHEHGADIDSADIVIRFNDAPTSGFESNVGRKDVMRLMNNLFASELLANRSSTLEEDVTYVVFPISEQEIADTAKVQHLHPNVEIYSADMGLQRAVTTALRSLYPASWFQLGQSGSDWVATTGAAGMIIALSICSEVHAYGMASSALEHEYPYHYYDRAFAFEKSRSALMPWDWHADENFFHKTFSAEKDLWKRLSATPSEEVERTNIAVIEGFSEMNCTTQELSLLSRVHPPEDFRFTALPVDQQIMSLASFLCGAWLLFTTATLGLCCGAPSLLGRVAAEGDKVEGRTAGLASLLGYSTAVVILQGCVVLSAFQHDGLFLWNPVFTLLLAEAGKGIFSILLCGCCCAGAPASTVNGLEGDPTPRSSSEDKEAQVPLVATEPSAASTKMTTTAKQSMRQLWVEAALRSLPVALCRVYGAYSFYVAFNLRYDGAVIRWRGGAALIVAVLWMILFCKHLPVYQWLAVAGVLCGAALASLHVLGCAGHILVAMSAGEVQIAVAVVVLAVGSLLNEDVLKRASTAALGIDRLNAVLFLQTSLLCGAAVLYRTVILGETVMFQYAGYDLTTVALIAAEVFAGLVSTRALYHANSVAVAVLGNLAQLVEMLIVPIMVASYVDGISFLAALWTSFSACVLLVGLYRFGLEG
mmetsp:Transcript_63218/g.150769  ORF Transcript_63218/g.150769 Transcript_63218/m.150769 type:complete len:740 (-) Transcript_63218:59-2278(-)